MNKLKFILLFSLLIGIFFISCDKHVFTGSTETTEIESGKIYINSNPNGMKIFFDNKNMSVVTPDTLFYLQTGEHKITLKHELYLDTTFTADIDPSSVNSYIIDLTKNPKFYATLDCYTNPDFSKIYLNDNYTGLKTPSTLHHLLPGKYMVKFEKDMCRSDSVFVSLKSNDDLIVSTILEDTTIAVTYRKKNSQITSDVITKVVVDNQNNKWIGTGDAGLLKFDGKKFTSYKNAGVFHNLHVSDILIDSKNRIWVGTVQGLNMLEGDVWQSFDSNLPSLNVTALAEDKTGNIWIGTDNGLLEYNNSTFKLYNKENSGILDDNITAIAVSPINEIWVGTTVAQVQQLHDGKWIHHSFDNLAPPISHLVLALFFDNNGVLWCYLQGNPKDGTRSVTMKLDGSWNYGSLPLDYPVEVVSFNYHAGVIWVCLKTGLAKVAPNQFLVLYNSIKYGFYSKVCASSDVDLNEDIFVGTTGGGLIKIKKGYY